MRCSPSFPAGDLDAGSPPEGMVAFGLAVLRVGVRFPLNHFIRIVLTNYRIAPHQLHPNGYSSLLGLEQIFRILGRDHITLRELRAFFELRKAPESGYYYLFPVKGKGEQFFYTSPRIDPKFGNFGVQQLDLSFGVAG